ncbi:unconventional myosin-XVIIIa-like isoform X1 [Dendronephthya gigantea]|uniref:unconventional myosin-XVIIIa-like isoform X1 n=1 Tax=Dendronephthya gigantea TaxID=151771 RepID=UPI001069640C|nr:unconventional myosin-XVIIIa-like isoform X1 [Dendronephthya gigantea]XP_028393080.1 unconventional myosin-XVIIIa-like isoform X1 [Dendronephthya gigantea]XP_028393081.1 unconventional myosin-XVIIIa-like isoform X1 [Dendronephthya gigantea]
MSRSKAPAFEDDFEILQTNNNQDELASESAYPGQSESRNMENGESLSSSERSVSAERPVPVKRTRTPVGNDNEKEQHYKRELQWLKEKEELLAKKKAYENELKRKDEDISWLQEQMEKQEEIKNFLLNEVESLKTEKEKLEKRIYQCEAKMEEDCEKIKELEGKSQESEVGLLKRNKELEDQVNDLQTSLQDKETLLDDTSKNVKVFEEREEEHRQIISRLENELATVREDLANMSEQKDEKSQEINELESRNMQIQEMRSEGEQESIIRIKALQDQYDDLLSIHDGMEKELHQCKTNFRKATQENQQILQQKDEAIRRTEEQATELEHYNNSIREVTQEKDALESELIEVKLRARGLREDNDSQSREMEEVLNKSTHISDERDFYAKKCKELEQGVRLNAQIEIKQLTQTLEALRGENDVIRKRSDEYKDDNAALRSEKMALEEKLQRFRATGADVRATGADVGRENGGYSRSLGPKDEPFRQKSINLEEENTSHRETRQRMAPTSTEQWYDSGEGARLLQRIYEELLKIFSTIEINRATSTKDISLLITTDRSEIFNVNFPKDFPKGAVSVMHNGRRTEFMSGRGKNAVDTCQEVVKMLKELAYGYT